MLEKYSKEKKKKQQIELVILSTLTGEQILKHKIHLLGESHRTISRVGCNLSSNGTPICFQDDPALRQQELEIFLLKQSNLMQIAAKWLIQFQLSIDEDDCYSAANDL